MLRRATRRRLCLFAILSISGCRYGPGLKPTAEELTAQARLGARVDALLAEKQRELHLPGLALAIVKDDRVVYLKAFGWRDVEHRLPATVDTVFPIGSCTKAFTSMAVAIAADERLLSLDDPPRRFLPYFKMADPDADARVTLRDMLSHRTGLMAKADLAAEPAVLTREQYVEAATSAKPTAKFRSAFQYSNAMFSAVGEIVGKANQTSWEDVIERKILRPLAMNSSITSLAQLSKPADHATGYVQVAEQTWRPVAPPRSLSALGPGGAVASTARDMTRWIRMLSNGGSVDDKRIVSEAMLRELTTPHIAIDGRMAYALGWVTYLWNGVTVVEHNGGSEGISALVSFIPGQRTGFVFLANTSPNFMTKIGNAGKLLWPLIFDRAEVSTPPELPRDPASARPVLAPTPPTPAATSASAAPDLPPVETLLKRMVAAVGGEGTLRRHTSLEIHAFKSYDNQGVTAATTLQAKAPDRSNAEEVWTAAGREIGRLRVYFDGRSGGQETTFGQDATNDDAANERARKDHPLHPLLALTHLAQDIRIVEQNAAGIEEAYVMELLPKSGAPVRLLVSVRSALVLERASEGHSATFDDYHAVDGELIPFHTTLHDELGETNIHIRDARFNAPVGDAAFRAAKKTNPAAP